MAESLVQEYARHWGVHTEDETNAGDASNKTLLPAIRYRDRDGTEEADPNAEWILLKAVVSLTVNGTIHFRDGTAAITQTYPVTANIPTEIPLQVPKNVGLGKLLSYTTTGGGNVTMQVWATERRYKNTKPAGARGS